MTMQYLEESQSYKNVVLLKKDVELTFERRTECVRVTCIRVLRSADPQDPALKMLCVTPDTGRWTSGFVTLLSMFRAHNDLTRAICDEMRPFIDPEILELKLRAKRQQGTVVPIESIILDGKDLHLWHFLYKREHPIFLGACYTFNLTSESQKAWEAYQQQTK